jgi:hypothetical protein
MTGKLTVYRVKECGYYERGADAHTCCDLSKCLSDIATWVTVDRPTIEKTCAYPGDEHGTSLPIYCFDAASHGQHDFLLTTWNAAPSDNGAVAAVPRNDIVGNAGVQTRTFPQTSIPGYGTHFWFLADRQRLVTVRFDSQPLNGHYGLNLYMRGYLERLSPHVRFGEDGGEQNVFMKNILGYALTDRAEEADAKLKPRFKSVLVRRDSEIEYIRRNRAKIKRIIRKSRPTKGGQATRNLVDRMLSFVGGAVNERVLPDRGFMFEVSYTPTAAELTEIIRRYDPDEDHETWDDIGFDFADGNTRRWLSSTTLKVDVELPDALRNGAGAVASAGALLEALQPFRGQVIV